MLGAMTKRRKVLGLVAVFLAALILWEGYNSLRWSGRRVAADLLEETPRGTTREEVLALIRARRWGRVGFFGTVEPPGSVGAEVGGYRGFLGRYRAWAFWVFDEDDRLTSIQVYMRWIDAP
jgi:hypothetical protein